MTSYLSSLWRNARLAWGLRWKRGYPDLDRVQAFLFRATMAAAAVTLVLTTEDYAARLEQMTAEAESNQAWAKVAIDCLNGSSGYYLNDAKLAVMCQRI